MDTPDTPDPFDTAQAQMNANVGAGAAGAIINNYDENNPYAKVKYKQTGFDKVAGPDGSMIKVPTYKKVTKFKPDQKELFKQQNQIASSTNQLAIDQINKLSGILNDPFTLDGAPSVSTPDLQTDYGSFNYDTSFGGDNPMQMGIDPTSHAVQYGIPDTSGNIQYGFGDTQEGVTYDFGVDDWSNDRSRVEQAIMSRYDDLEKKNIDNLDARLAAQGIDPRNDAARSEFYDLAKSRNDAEMQAILAGGQEQSRLQGLKTQAGLAKNAAQGQEFAQKMSRGEFNNAAQQQEWTQLQAQVAQLNEAQQQEFQQALQSGQFTNAAQAQAFLQAQARGQFAQQGTAMNEGAARNAAAFSNDVLSNLFNMEGSQRDRYIRELLLERQTPLNEISALTSGNQVTLPDFPDPYQQAMGAPNLMDFIANNYNQQMQYAQAMNGQLMSGMFGLAGQII